MEPVKSSIITHFESLEDFRIDRTKKHELVDIIFLTLSSMICGFDTWEEIELFGNVRIDWFRRYIKLSNGVPSHDTIRRVFMGLNPEKFQESFSSWVESLDVKTKGKIVAIDGKTLRGSHGRGKGKRPIHMVSAWLCENDLVLGQCKVNEKSNEITAIPELLELLVLEGSTITIDAMGCQKNIAAKIRDAGADYVLGLKGNQGHLSESVEEFFTTAYEKDFLHVPFDQSVSVDGEHGRIVTRSCYAVSSRYIEEAQGWVGLKSIVMVVSERHTDNEALTEKRYYISSHEPDAAKLGHAVRTHWSIENGLNWCLDVGFNEDQCRIREGYAAENIAVIRQMALNMIKSDSSKKGGIARKRKLASIDNRFLETLLFRQLI